MPTSSEDALEAVLDTHRLVIGIVTIPFNLPRRVDSLTSALACTLVEDANGQTLVGSGGSTCICNGCVIGLVFIQTLEMNLAVVPSGSMTKQTGRQSPPPTPPLDVPCWRFASLRLAGLSAMWHPLRLTPHIKPLTPSKTGEFLG
jgi:hypothetical protein